MGSPDRRSDRFAHQVTGKAARRRWAREHRRSVWFGFGMFGVVGWSVALPTVLGVVVGLWLDARTDGGTVSWTLTCLLIGVVVGCLLAWHWVTKEGRDG